MQGRGLRVALKALALAVAMLAITTCGGGGNDGAGPAPAAGGAAPGSLRPRVLPRKPDYTQTTDAHETDRITVKFRDDSGVRCANGQPVIEDPAAHEGLPEALAASAGAVWRPLTPVPGERLALLRARARQRLGQEVADFCVHFLLILPPELDAAHVCDMFNRCPIVEMAAPRPKPTAPPLPPDLVDGQGYLDEAPGGIGAERAWTQCPTRGAGIRVCDIEYGFNGNHQDLPAITRLISNAGIPDQVGFDDNHGTAVFGELASLDNGFGTTGACHQATFFFAGEYQCDAGTDADGICLGPGTSQREAAILAAVSAFAPGGAFEGPAVILLEMQTAGPNFVPGSGSQFGLVPAEWAFPVYDAVLTAIGNDITVVAAAGNGSQDLDSAEYNAGHAPFLLANDSGSIIVGAGGSSGSGIDRQRLGFSCYGATVDLQGWGDSVVTTGYGNHPDSDALKDLWYTSTFSGTSSASPIVTAAVTLLQSATLAQTGSTLTPAEVKTRLRSTGSPQLGPAENIGPRPNVLAAIGCIDLLCPGNATIECASSMGTLLTVPITVTATGAAPIPMTVRVNGALADFLFLPAAGGTHMFTFSYAFGANSVEVTAADGMGVAACTFTVSVVDTTPPAIVCPPDMIVECDGHMGTIVHYPAPTATDACDPNPSVVCAPPPGAAFPLGPTVVTCTATDGHGNMSFCQFTVTVVDTTPPVVDATVRRPYLFLPRGAMLDSLLTRTITDLCDPDPTVMVEVWGSEPDALPLTPDAAVVGAVDAALHLRVEVDLAGAAAGRAYLVIVTATDMSMNVGRGCAWAVVPKTVTASDLLGVRTVALAAVADCEAMGIVPPGWVQLLPPTPLPTP